MENTVLFIHLLHLDLEDNRGSAITGMIDRIANEEGDAKFIANGEMQLGQAGWHYNFKWYQIPSKIAGVLLTDSVILDNYVMVYNERDYYIGIPEGKFREFQDFLFGIRTE